MSNADTIIRGVEAFYRAYIDGFNREDTDAFLSSFDYPHAWLSEERGLLTTVTTADQQHFHQHTMASLHQRGWGRSGIDRLQVWPFANSLAMIVADVTRYKKDESVLEKLRACYMVRRDAGAWKILTVTEVKPPFSGPGVVRNA